MTTDGGTNWDEARIALGRVSKLLQQRADAPSEELIAELRGLEGYQLIPQPVRETVEGLNPEERGLVNRLFVTLAENRFYLENNLGQTVMY
jgi:hypothetical protein